jgi:hypothetical protein
MPVNRQPPSIEELSRCLAARIARDGRRPAMETIASDHRSAETRARSERSRRTCHIQAEPKTRHAPPRDSGAYVPEMAARVEDDRNLTDGARRCARKLMAYVYRRNRNGRSADITVTYLMRALGKGRRTVQRYLRQLEREGYIAVEVVHARTRMCAGLFIELLAPLFPRHHRQKWPQKLIDSDAPQKSQNDRSRYRTRLIPRILWAVRCTEPIRRAWDGASGVLSEFPAGF